MKKTGINEKSLIFKLKSMKVGLYKARQKVEKKILSLEKKVLFSFLFTI